jgi:membrane glycosyltransferase
VPRQPAERPADVRAEPARGAPQRLPDRRAGVRLAPLWLGFLLLSTLLFTRHAHDIPIYFIEPYQMFPIWPSANLKLILTLFGLTGVLLLAPKAMSLLVILLRGRAWCYGGAAA